jgi:arylsulfatase A-like enzyme
VLCGVHHVVQDPRTVGYRTILDVGGGDTGDHAISDTASAFLRGRKAETEPFFLAVGFGSTHRPYPEPGPEDDPRFIRLPAPIPDAAETRRDMAGYGASVRRLDECMGGVFDALEDAGLAGDTLVVCTTDHGIAFPYMKCNLTAHGTGVMLILRGPGGYAGGVVSDALVSHLDVFPTLCEAAGLPYPDWLQGTPLPTADDADSPERKTVYSEVNYHAAYEPMRAVRSARWNYIRRFGDFRRPMLANIDDSPAKSYLVERGLGNRRLADEELYDLVFDPEERNNVAGAERHAGTLSEMRKHLERWMRETGDPLLDGPVPMASGARYNLPTDDSPKIPAHTAR